MVGDWLATFRRAENCDQSTAFSKSWLHAMTVSENVHTRLLREGTVVHMFVLLAAAMTSLSSMALAHGDVAPQQVDTSALPLADGEALAENPYRDTADYDVAIKIGDKAYNQNCARCHGLGAVSGGIAPDLRYLIPGEDDEYFIEKVRLGAVRNGVTYMPPFGEIFSDEAIWAIRSWLDTVAEE